MHLSRSAPNSRPQWTCPSCVDAGARRWTFCPNSAHKPVFGKLTHLPHLFLGRELRRSRRTLVGHAARSGEGPYCIDLKTVRVFCVNLGQMCKIKKVRGACMESRFLNSVCSFAEICKIHRKSLKNQKNTKSILSGWM
jgi:hypothetical protein